jgi:phosphotransferase system  glucose/maltose/N-acetylglucosamine-specific IIC component
MLPVSVLPVAGILLGVGSANFSWLPQAAAFIQRSSAMGQGVGNNDGKKQKDSPKL